MTKAKQQPCKAGAFYFSVVCERKWKNFKILQDQELVRILGLNKNQKMFLAASHLLTSSFMVSNREQTEVEVTAPGRGGMCRSNCVKEEGGMKK